jgi:AraC family transcriptional regulator
MKYNFQVLYGNIVKSKTISELKLTETAYNSGLQLSAHSHDFAYFCFVLRGNFSENYEKQTRSCKPFSLIFHPSQETHSDEFLSATRCFNLQINDSFLERIRQYSKFTETPVEINGGSSKQVVAKIYKEFCYTDEMSSLVVEGLMFELLGEAIRFSKVKLNPPNWLNQTRELLRDRFRENLSLTEIAAAVGVHETHLSREFKRYYRLTVGDYLRRLRIEYACQRISTTNTPISQIALLCGFADQSHFTKAFGRIMLMSPAAYRKIFRPR